MGFTNLSVVYSIWSFTVFLGLCQNCATLCDPQRLYGNQDSYGRDYQKRKIIQGFLILGPACNCGFRMFCFFFNLAKIVKDMKDRHLL